MVSLFSSSSSVAASSNMLEPLLKTRDLFACVCPGPINPESKEIYILLVQLVSCILVHNYLHMQTLCHLGICMLNLWVESREVNGQKMPGT